jgi:hypothetical protein
MSRPINIIAEEIARDWRKPYFGAEPYLEAMHSIISIDDQFFNDSARSVVRYFLANATTWRGETARRIKAELKQLCEACPVCGDSACETKSDRCGS